MSRNKLFCTLLSSFLSLSNDKQTDVELKHLQWCLKGLETVTCLRLLKVAYKIHARAVPWNRNVLNRTLLVLESQKHFEKLFWIQILGSILVTSFSMGKSIISIPSFHANNIHQSTRSACQSVLASKLPTECAWYLESAWRHRIKCSMNVACGKKEKKYFECSE